MGLRDFLLFLLLFFAGFFYHFELVKAESLTATASAEIKSQIVISEASSMSFGTILVKDTSDTITLDLTGNISVSGSSNSAGGAQNANFSVTGSPNTFVTISFSNGTLSGTGSNMSINNFVHSAGSSPQLDETGTLAFDVGADLNINSNQSSGSYFGTYQVTIAYQ